MNTSLKNARIFDTNSWEEIDGSSNDQDSICGLDDSFEIIDEVNSEEDDDNDKANFSINKETFVNFTIKPEISLSPMKIDDDTNANNSNDSRRSLKSAKKTSFKHKLDSPYKRTDVSETKLTTVAFDLDKNNDKTANCSKKQPKRKERELETDPAVLARRQKQIDYGKNTIAYDAYRKAILKEERKLGDPETPDKYHKYSRRAWDGLIKKWRLLLHKYDPVPLIKRF